MRSLEKEKMEFIYKNFKFVDLYQNNSHHLKLDVEKFGSSFMKTFFYYERMHIETIKDKFL